MLDETLSERLVSTIAPRFPDALHARPLGLGGAANLHLWEAGIRNRSVLVTKDDDVATLSVLRGTPPKVVWLNVGNAGATEIASVVLDSAGVIEQFVAHAESGFLALGPRSRSG